jgi:hypothetical protein
MTTKKPGKDRSWFCHPPKPSTAVKIIKDNLFQRGFLPESAYGLSSIHQLEALY